MTSALEQGVPLGQDVTPQSNGIPPPEADITSQLRAWAEKYRGATVADLDLPPALSTSPSTSLEEAMLSASSHDYSHLTVLSESTRSLLGYLPISKLRTLFESRQLQPSDPVSKAMVRFQRGGGRRYVPITMDTDLAELEGFFGNVGPLSSGMTQDFAVVTDGGRKFVLGVVTRADLHEIADRIVDLFDGQATEYAQHLPQEKARETSPTNHIYILTKQPSSEPLPPPGTWAAQSWSERINLAAPSGTEPIPSRIHCVRGDIRAGLPTLDGITFKMLLGVLQIMRFEISTGSAGASSEPISSVAAENAKARRRAPLKPGTIFLPA